MSVKGYTRAQINQLCLHLGDVIPTPGYYDGEPTPLTYGQTGDPGTTGLISRADHRHALSGIILGQTPIQWGDFETNSATFNTRLKRRNGLFGSVTLTNDQPGPQGAFGFDAVALNTLGSGGNGHIAYAQTGTVGVIGVTTERLHSVARLRHLHIRVRARQTVGVANNQKVLIGGLHETTDADFDTIDDALGFLIQRDVAGNGNFRAFTRSSTTGLDTDIDLGAGWTGADFTSFEILQPEVGFLQFVADGVLVAEIEDNIPDQKLFGWGLFAEKTAATSNTAELWVDDFIFLGRT